MRTVRSPFDQAATVADAVIYRNDQDDPRGGVPGLAGRVGVLAPPAYASTHPHVRAHAHAECLLEAASDSVVRIRVRYLQLVTRSLVRRGPDGRFPAVDRISDRDVRQPSAYPPGWSARPGRVRTVGDKDPRTDGDPRTWDEFVPREVDDGVQLADLLAAPPDPPAPRFPRRGRWLPRLSVPRPDPWDLAAAAHHAGVRRGAGTAHIIRLTAPAGRRVESVNGGNRPLSTRVIWDSWAVQGELRVSAGLQPGPHHLVRLRAELANLSGWRPGTGLATDPAVPRTGGQLPVMRHSLVGAHLLLDVTPGRFVSLSAPPTWAGEAASDCRNDGLWPAVLGTPDGGEVVLVAPIVLPDHAQADVGARLPQPG